MDAPRDDADAGQRPRSAGARRALAVCAVVLVAVFVALGTWQVKRLQWKLDLIDRVDARVHARPTPAPGPDAWAGVTAAEHEYRHVALTGVLLTEYTTKVKALSDLGGGFWLLTPMCREDGAIVFVNRGFVAPPDAARIPAPATAKGDACAAARGRAPATITGLLRIGEGSSGFLQENDPANDRWYARQIGAIAAARGLARVAPYFVDADAGQEPDNGAQGGDAAPRPTGGLTVISFHNNHLVYALTWYALALMTAGAFLWVARDERRRSKKA
ncbi:SURF1 family protein [Pseudoduganella namucuonensis]|uniref:SURF1-like protein n=1 Tax=Pseudoduganella namucuonensis TaxID=1035707 RepID=A0A1I7HDZ9_9BURK|nr:SURF1 family protein [Pseudoduganella namucuonensis]SFU58945.1 surfeit locus 1 family protein [Pseudoduganella namucuonensis]